MTIILHISHISRQFLYTIACLSCKLCLLSKSCTIFSLVYISKYFDFIFISAGSFSSKHEYTMQAKSSRIVITKVTSLQKFLVLLKISYQCCEKLSILPLTLFYTSTLTFCQMQRFVPWFHMREHAFTHMLSFGYL